MDPLKDWAREQAIECRATARRAADLEAATRLADGFVRYFKPGRKTTLSGYWPAGDEFDVMRLLELLHVNGCSIALPASASYGAPVQSRRWAPADTLVTGPYGTLQPGNDAPTVVPSISLVPLLAFDRKCNALTESHGLYFQMLSALPPLSQRRSVTIGVAYAAQQIDAVPTRQLDQPVNYVVTEAGIMQAPPENTPSAAEALLWAVFPS